jgi:SAM-dependent methyltransferase
MKTPQELEVEYARRLRASTPAQRRRLYAEAYGVVSELVARAMSEAPEERTAGTSPALVRSLARLCASTDHVLEVGCGRGYTCLKLAPHVTSLIGLDVSDPALEEARELLSSNGVSNVTLQKGLADGLTDYFGYAVFDKVISLDVYEHLHPEDAIAHLRETYAVLKPGGQYIVVTPSRLTGPHDITKQFSPHSSEPLGFHLNETTCAELSMQLQGAGFTTLRSVLPLSFKLSVPLDIIYPARLLALLESLYDSNSTARAFLRGFRIVGRLFIIAGKPKL